MKKFLRKNYWITLLFVSIFASLLTSLGFLSVTSLAIGGVEPLVIGGPSQQTLNVNYLLIQTKDERVSSILIQKGDSVLKKDEIKNRTSIGWRYVWEENIIKSPAFTVLIYDENNKVINGAWFTRQVPSDGTSATNTVFLTSNSKQYIDPDAQNIYFEGTLANAKYIEIRPSSVFFKVQRQGTISSNKLYYETFCGSFNATGFDSKGEIVNKTSFTTNCNGNITILNILVSNILLVVNLSIIYFALGFIFYFGYKRRKIWLVKKSK